MARYPDSPAPQGNASTPYPFKLMRPLARGGPDWAQRTRALTRGDLFRADLTYNALSWAQVQTLYAFWTAHINGTFSFADFNGYVYGVSDGPGVAWTDLFVAKGDGLTQTWTLPTYVLQCNVAGGLIGDVTVKVNGTAKPNLTLHPDTSGSDGYIQQGAGVDGFDFLSLASAPAASAIVTISGTCRRGIRTARFLTDEFPLNLRNPANFASGTISIMEQIS
jgi:hypothetical protein